MGSSEAIAAYRFLNNDLVTPEKIIDAHIKCSVERLKECSIVLCLQDTSDISMKHMSAVKDLGVVNNTSNPGCCIHPLVAFTPERLCLGVLHNEFIIREAESLGQDKPKDRPIEEKESFRWIKGYRRTCEIANESPDTTFVCIGDRESDIYELLVEATDKKNKAELLIRASHDRRIELETDKAMCTKMRRDLQQAPVKGTISFTLEGRGGKKKREVTQEIKAKKITVVPRNGLEAPRVKINAVLLQETNVPDGESAVNWMLLTTLPITTEEELKNIVKYYLSRWAIETFFHVLKNGCTVEKLQFKTAQALLPCLALYMVISWRLLYLLFLGRTCPEISCTTLFKAEEWQSVYAVVCKKRPPKEPPTLGEIVNLIAKSGGYLGRKHNGPPGPKVMWRGLQNMAKYAESWLAHAAYASSE